MLHAGILRCVYCESHVVRAKGRGRSCNRCNSSSSSMHACREGGTGQGMAPRWRWSSTSMRREAGWRWLAPRWRWSSIRGERQAGDGDGESLASPQLKSGQVKSSRVKSSQVKSSQVKSSPVKSRRWRWRAPCSSSCPFSLCLPPCPFDSYARPHSRLPV